MILSTQLENANTTQRRAEAPVHISVDQLSSPVRPSTTNRKGDPRPSVDAVPDQRGSLRRGTSLSACMVGGLTIDDLVFWPSGKTYMARAGGNSLYSALGARVWVENVTAVSRRGSDYPLQQLRQIESRIRLSLIPFNGPSMHAWGLYESDGERQWVPHPGSGTQDEMTPQPDELPQELWSSQAFHLASMPADIQVAWARRLRDRGRLVSADPTQFQIARGEDMQWALMRLVDFYLPSAAEARLLYGSADPEGAARAFAKCGLRAVVIKLGAEGSLIYDSVTTQLSHVPAYGNAIDPTGGGDAFCGGFLSGYLITGDSLAAAQRGAVSASFAVENVGMLSLLRPGKSRVTERLMDVCERTTVGSHSAEREG